MDPGLSQYNDVAVGTEMVLHHHTMIMVPAWWSAFSAGTTPALTWSVFPFKDASRTKIPNVPGVYAFLVVPNIAGNLSVSYLMYIGKTDRPLRQRFGEYMLEAKSDRIRPNLLRILPRYPDHLVFACAETPAGIAPKNVETALLRAFVPPCNDQLPATILRAKKAFKL